jgi:hypothetical protein
MSTPDTDWNPDDGPPPTEEELREAARLAEALDRPVAPAVMTPESAELLRVAGRVKATARPDDAAARAAADRAVRRALQGAARPGAWWNPTRVRFAAAAAAVLVAAGLGGREYARSRPQPAASAEPVFDAPVEPGAGSAPASRLYDHGLRSYRDGLLGGSP